MTSRQRMLTAYRNQQPDVVPVSPELWYDIPLVIAGVPFEEVCLGRYPVWTFQLQAHAFFGSDAWIVPFPGPSAAGPAPRVTTRRLDDGGLEIEYRYETTKGPLRRVTRNTESYYDWTIEHPVKDFAADMPKYEEIILADPNACDLTEIHDARAQTGENGIVTPYVGTLFFNLIASAREGESTQAIFDFVDHEDYLSALHEKYLHHLAIKTRRIIQETRPDVVFLDNGFSTMGISNPQMYRRWDKPVIQTVARIAHDHGVLLHVHQHGKSLAILPELIDAGADLVEPLERPPSGDICDLAAVKTTFGQRIALRGNLHSHEVLLRGTPADVERQVRECIDAAAARGGYILATGDGAILGTPFENIHAMVEAGRKYGRYE